MPHQFVWTWGSTPGINRAEEQAEQEINIHKTLHVFPAEAKPETLWRCEGSWYFDCERLVSHAKPAVTVCPILTSF